MKKVGCFCQLPSLLKRRISLGNDMAAHPRASGIDIGLYKYLNDFPQCDYLPSVPDEMLYPALFIVMRDSASIDPQ